MQNLTLGHGAGGRLTAELIESIIGTGFSSGPGGDREDCALLPEGLAVTIDSFTVTPRSFPGGDIGSLAMCGSVNDLSMRGVRPMYMAMGVVAEEGFSGEELENIMRSAASVCGELGISLVTGDTKVMPKGQVDGLLITTCALGRPETDRTLGASNLRPGDAILLTTSPGRHGASIAAARYNLKTASLFSDCAPLWNLVEPLLSFGSLRCMRDCTRGGVGTVMCEWSEQASLGIDIEEKLIPRNDDVHSVCDLLGFDPLYLACEGCAAVAVAPEDTEKTLVVLRSNPLGKEAALIGYVTAEHPGMVGMRTLAGGKRLVDMPVGEMLPRIC